MYNLHTYDILFSILFIKLRMRLHIIMYQRFFRVVIFLFLKRHFYKLHTYKMFIRINDDVNNIIFNHMVYIFYLFKDTVKNCIITLYGYQIPQLSCHKRQIEVSTRSLFFLKFYIKIIYFIHQGRLNHFCFYGNTRLEARLVDEGKCLV